MFPNIIKHETWIEGRILNLLVKMIYNFCKIQYTSSPLILSNDQKNERQSAIYFHHYLPDFLFILISMFF